ncbi:5,6-dimethylbenzimidazole synthase [Corynebacterium sp. 13CS0277]|uniref:5,6-dimethylbenzimidazole synthase n=1 Tax=Corynebacterium sp. 13CS0277 TaxID=2071994 RepID=UPI000D03DE95|nr:5,6-dimethylbenzimidazole synthase [Corynebacterium sp. 13CS0277]PRQ11251.1 5,6-dimethylbenzimidazole synthase [Corynebacterium sp. 13CS0277]
MTDTHAPQSAPVDLGFDTLPSEARTVYTTISRRRDVRAEFSGERLDEKQLRRILAAAHAAPSVGNSQPWDFVIIRDDERLKEFAAHVATRRQAFADSLPEDRKDVFNPIKIEGIVESGTGIVVTYDPTRGGPNILGRHTIDDTGLMSAVLAIQNLWLAATVEGLGVGWVSFYEEDFLSDFIGATHPVRPIAWLCVGPVTHLEEVPDLERFGWRARRPLDDAIHEDRLR